MRAKFTVYPDKARKQARETTVKSRLSIAQKIAMEARLSAPILKGAYRGGMGVKSSGVNVLVEDTDATAKFKEYGTSRTPAHAELTNAARQYGEYTGWQPR